MDQAFGDFSRASVLNSRCYVASKAWSPYSCKDRRACSRRCFKEDFKAVRISIEKVPFEISKLAIIPTIGRAIRICTS